MLEIEEKHKLYVEIRKLERLLQLTRHPERRKQIEYKLQKLYFRLREILWDEKEEKGMIKIPESVIGEEDEKTEKEG